MELRALQEFWPRSIYHTQHWFTAFFCCLTKCPAGQEASTGENRQRTKIQSTISLVDCEKMLKREKSNNEHFRRILHSTELNQKGAKSSLFIEGVIRSGFWAKFKPKSSSEQFVSSSLCKMKLRFHQQLNQYNGVVTPHRRKIASSSSPSSSQLCRPTPLRL